MARWTGRLRILVRRADCVRVDTNARFDGIEGALSWRPDPKDEFAEIYDDADGGQAEGKLVNYLAANMIRTFGRGGWKDKWSRIALSEMKRLRFNTVGNWSDWKFASAARFPYVRPMEFRGKRSGMIYRDFRTFSIGVSKRMPPSTLPRFARRPTIPL